jgi:SpoVK/Ycf46/Vps4 family AAA+-type ATPase
MRKGRFDETFLARPANRSERVDIMLAALRAHGRMALDVDAVADVTDGFTGSEIAALVPEALFTAFADGGREIEIADLLAAAATVVPLSKTAAEKIESLRAWAAGRARAATSAEVVEIAAARGRALDL